MVLSILLVSMDAGRIAAIAPPYVADDELAQYPIIVVAHWTKAPFTNHSRVEGHELKDWEVRTEVEIDRVIKGDVKPGKYVLLTGFRIGWKNDDRIMSYMSTQMAGDTDNLVNPNIWFLRLTKSWDAADKNEYLYLDSYRGVQPLVLEEYFAALRSEEPAKNVLKLIDSQDPEVLRRVLRYICGGVLPWPYDDEFTRHYMSPEKQGRVLTEATDAVAALLDCKDVKIRELAVSVYDALKGKDAIPRLRERLKDSEPRVQAVAAGLLVRHRDAASIANICAATSGLGDMPQSYALVEALSDWKDARLAPALFPYLQNESNYGRIAIKARAALHEFTGQWFPFDAALSRSIWEKTQKAADENERKRIFAELLPYGEQPLAAELVSRDAGAFIRVVNRSKSEIAITRAACGTMEYKTGDSSGTSCYGGNRSNKDDYVNIAAGQALEIPVILDDSFLHAELPHRSMTISFEHTGREFGVKAWIGRIQVEFGKDWKEPERKLEPFVEKWPNGNIKTRGQKINGYASGHWDYFNEAGDRIWKMDYTKGTGADDNPEHPSNKGKGIVNEKCENKK